MAKRRRSTGSRYRVKVGDSFVSIKCTSKGLLSVPLPEDPYQKLKEVYGDKELRKMARGWLILGAYKAGGIDKPTFQALVRAGFLEPIRGIRLDGIPEDSVASVDSPQMVA